MPQRLFSNFFQQAYVTTDLDRAKERFAEQFGVAAWFDMHAPTEMRTPAGPGIADLKIALAFVGDLQLELIEPVGGPAAKLYAECLPADRFAIKFHHQGFRVPGSRDDWNAFRAAIGNERYPIAIEGDLDFVQFAYVDARADLGHYLEYIWADRDIDAVVPRN